MSAVPKLEEMGSPSDFETAARKKISESSLDYIDGGEKDTIARNAEEFAMLGFRPRVLCDVSTVDLGCSYFGKARKTPFYLSSVAKGALVCGKLGEIPFVRAVARAGSDYIVPMISSKPYTDIWGATVSEQRLPFQYYLLTDEEESEERLQEALKHSPSAIVVTVDANGPRAGSFGSGTTTATGGLVMSPKLTWKRLLELKRQLPPDMPVYLKGVQTAEDALQAASIGVQGLIVSNHGGRCCDQAWGALSALQDVAGALRTGGFFGKVELLLDSGVRSGRDAMKALCLGAQCVGLGRAYYWAAACHGEEGIVRLLGILDFELRHAMAQVGAASLSDLGPHLLCSLNSLAQPLVPPPLARARL